MLATHQIQYLHDEDNVVVMGMGQLQLQGKFEIVKSSLNNLNYFRDYGNLHVSENNMVEYSDETAKKVRFWKWKIEMFHCVFVFW